MDVLLYQDNEYSLQCMDNYLERRIMNIGLDINWKQQSQHKQLWI